MSAPPPYSMHAPAAPNTEVLVTLHMAVRSVSRAGLVRVFPRSEGLVENASSGLILDLDRIDLLVATETNEDLCDFCCHIVESLVNDDIQVNRGSVGPSSMRDLEFELGNDYFQASRTHNPARRFQVLRQWRRRATQLCALIDSQRGLGLHHSLRGAVRSFFLVVLGYLDDAGSGTEAARLFIDTTSVPNLDWTASIEELAQFWRNMRPGTLAEMESAVGCIRHGSSHRARTQELLDWLRHS